MYCNHGGGYSGTFQPSIGLNLCHLSEYRNSEAARRGTEGAQGWAPHPLAWRGWKLVLMWCGPHTTRISRSPIAWCVWTRPNTLPGLMGLWWAEPTIQFPSNRTEGPNLRVIFSSYPQYFLFTFSPQTIVQIDLCSFQLDIFNNNNFVDPRQVASNPAFCLHKIVRNWEEANPRLLISSIERESWNHE